MADEGHTAGQGAVLLDIGGGAGALIVTMPAHLAGAEIELCPLDEPRWAAPREHVGVHVRLGTPTRGLAAVFPSVPAGRYKLYRKPDGVTEVVAEVRGGRVCEVVWPGAG